MNYRKLLLLIILNIVTFAFLIYCIVIVIKANGEAIKFSD